MLYRRCVFYLTSPTRFALIWTQATFVNHNSNNNFNSGSGSITNNNWNINYVQIEEEQVSSFAGKISRRSHTLYNRRRP